MNPRRGVNSRHRPFPWDSVFFDFDGVLVDSLPVKDAAFLDLFRNETPALRRKILAYHRREGGLSRRAKFRRIYRSILRRALPVSEERRLGGQFARFVEGRVVRRPLIRGTRDLLRFLSRRTRLTIVSGSPMRELRRIIRRQRLDSYFKGGVHGSPPEKTQLLGRLLRRSPRPSRPLFVGDSQNDFIAARRWGVEFIARRSRGMAWRGVPVVADMRALERWLRKKAGERE